MPNPGKPASINADTYYDIRVNRVVDEQNIRFRPKNAYPRVIGSLVAALGDAVESAVESEVDNTPAPGGAGG